MDTFLIIVWFILMIVGVVGAFLPVVPGPTITYISLLLCHFTTSVDIPTSILVWSGVIMVIVVLLDYYFPIVGAKTFGADKGGTWGVVIGSIVGLFFAPIGILICPFLGAVIGELIMGKGFIRSVVAGFGAFMGFISGTFMKAFYSLVLIGYLFVEVVILPWI